MRRYSSEQFHLPTTLNMTSEEHHLPKDYVTLHNASPVLQDHYVLYWTKAAAEMGETWLIRDDRYLQISAISRYNGAYNPASPVWYRTPEAEAVEEYRAWATRICPYSDSWIFAFKSQRESSTACGKKTSGVWRTGRSTSGTRTCTRQLSTTRTDKMEELTSWRVTSARACRFQWHGSRTRRCKQRCPREKSWRQAPAKRRSGFLRSVTVSSVCEGRWVKRFTSRSQQRSRRRRNRELAECEFSWQVLVVQRPGLLIFAAGMTGRMAMHARRFNLSSYSTSTSCST